MESWEELYDLPAKSSLKSISFGRSIRINERSIPSRLTSTAWKYPNVTAIEHLDSEIKYCDLELQATLLASLLHQLGVKSGDRVCLLVHRSLSFFVAIFAILKLAASYIPLDGGIVTDQTLCSVIKNSQSLLILCSSRYFHRGMILEVHALDLDKELAELLHNGSPPTLLPDPLTFGEAYVIYTSGTTGKPKGVSISHKNILNLVTVAPGNLGITPATTRVAQLMNVAFDMCAWETFASLLNGGTLILRPSGIFSHWEPILKSVQVIVVTPSILARFDPAQFPGIVTVATAGERCSQELADSWAKDRRFLNCCGPTEVTIINQVHEHIPGLPISIGFPTPNNSLYILGDDMKPVAQGFSGTLWAGGDGISEGYINLPSLTQQQFQKDPFTGTSSIMYNTGDIAKQMANGSFQYLGRRDDQVKIKGFRVELDGIAAAMETCPGVSSAVALYIENVLWGFYLHAKSQPVDSLSVQCAVQHIQPYYAVPTSYLALDSFPLTK
ncbi:AMP-binding protein [Lentinula edodes]|uniref:AMP-binding protein n=1 Tax=Lentinula lateritia TaxID=40482 RepID=A0A9W9DD99_9AGAR|nr:AMP-binding protein [Lentinula edodes]